MSKLERTFVEWSWEIGELAGEFGTAAGRTSPVEPIEPLQLLDQKLDNNKLQRANRQHRYEHPSLSIAHAAGLRTNGMWEGYRTSECLKTILEHTDEARAAIKGALDDFRPNLVIVENVFGLPLNPGYAVALSNLLEQRSIPAILRHHDLIWQRQEFDTDRLDPSLARLIKANFPPRLDKAVHVTINKLSKAQLQQRGIESTVIYNGFEFPNRCLNAQQRSTRRHKARQVLGIPQRSVVLVQPTRAIERKGVPDSIDFGKRLANKLGVEVCLLVCGPPEDGYDSQLYDLARDISSKRDSSRKSGSFSLLLGMGKLSIDLAYEAADFIVFPSHWEGFGNPVLESVAFSKPLVVRDYPVLSELTEKGLRFIAWDPDPLLNVIAWMNLDEPTKDRIFARNLEVAKTWFSLRAQACRLEKVLGQLGLPGNLR